MRTDRQTVTLTTILRSIPGGTVIASVVAAAVVAIAVTFTEHIRTDILINSLRLCSFINQSTKLSVHTGCGECAARRKTTRGAARHRAARQRNTTQVPGVNTPSNHVPVIFVIGRIYILLCNAKFCVVNNRDADNVD